MKRIPASEREQIGEEFVTIAERLVRKYGFTIPECRQYLHECLGVSV